MERSSVSGMEAAMEGLDSFYRDCKQETVKSIESHREEIAAFPISGLLTAEEQMINAYTCQASDAFDAGNYLDAMTEYEECLSVLKNIKMAGDYRIEIEQIEASSFPDIKLYFSAYQLQSNEKFEILGEYIELKELVSGTYQKAAVNKAGKLNEKENLNVCLVADMSGSMWSQIDIVKAAMTNFLNCLQYNVGDKAAIISFDDCVNINTDFSGEKAVLTNIVNSMYVENCTALYDALYVAVCSASRAEGAKCVIAFTDGYDNVSRMTKQEVIDAAKAYGVPVYLIGIGYDVDNASLQAITDSTGGYYWNISDGNAMQGIYNSIYQENKELYMVEYKRKFRISIHGRMCIWHMVMKTDI